MPDSFYLFIWRRRYWEPESVVYPLYGTDFTKGVLGATVPLPSNRSSGDGVLAGNGPSDGNMHGLVCKNRAAPRINRTPHTHPAQNEVLSVSQCAGHAA